MCLFRLKLGLLNACTCAYILYIYRHKFSIMSLKITLTSKCWNKSPKLFVLRQLCLAKNEHEIFHIKLKRREQRRVIVKPSPPMTTKHGISFFVFMITVHGSYHLLKHHCQFYWGCIPAVHQISPADSKWTHGFHRQPLALWCVLVRYVEYLEIKCLSPTVYFVFHPLYWLVSESHLKKKK